ncbi:Kinesin-like protein [Phytophthora fragariae]|nr:Kinesin-like protein [Phytophthora fragariae]KAE9127203.1 Kinesin-like protein [Phytophthora fragariae]KAE9150379.1 Kinesin-like protein [Phytophthora fragariae]KAE9246209.1 Kinesin-like protein [Phytophthora fragariae]KAE9246315.1 Kinesin-like protein [Phytophthora fragariae]
MTDPSSDLRRLSSCSVSSNHDAPPPPPTPTNVQVAVRCRPLNSREKAAGRGAVVQCRPNSSEVAVVKRKTYTFDRVFGQYSTQKDVFTSVVRPAVDEALAGYNCTVFAYGQTGTGKTYTMQGDLSPSSEMAGIIPRSVRCIFDALEASGEEFSVRVSFLQLYNEELKDLLDPDADKKLRLMEDAKRGGVYCVNLLEVTATTAKHVYELVNSGVKNRITSETLMNENSSRSHSIFTIRIHSKEHNAAGEDLLRVGQLNLVDLAGSECVGRSGARNARAREAGTINQSLLTLGRVITALVDNLPHVPYRDSKLTRLLQESLGGRAKTTIIATLAPCADSLDETLSTLEYAFRAKNIKNKPELNQKMTKAGLLNDFGSEIESLRAALRAARLKDGVYLPLEQFTDMQERLAGQGAQLSELEDMLKARNTSCKELEEAGEKHASEVAALTLANQEVSIKLVATESELTATKEMLEETKQELQQVQTKLKAYQHNEKMLLDSGSAAAKLYTDSEKRAAELVAKIESTQRIENANTSLATLYRNESQSQINEYLERLAKQKENQEGIFQDVSNALHELQTNHATNLDGLVTSLNALQGLVDARTAQVTESVAEDSAQKRVQRDEVTASVKEQQEAMEQQIEKLVEMSKNYAADVLEDLATSKSRTVAFLESMDLAVEGSREELNSFLTEQSDKLLELQVTIDMSIEKQTKELDESKAALTAALKDSHARQQEELNGMKAHLAQYIDKCLQSQTQKLDEQTIIIEENAKKQQKQLSNIQSITEQEMKTFVQAMGSHNSKHDSETAILRERFSKLRGQIGDANMRQTNLAQSHEQLQTTWINDVAALAESHTQSMTTLMERHAQTDMEISTTKQKQLTQFLSDHDDIRQLLNGGRNTLDKELQNHLSSTRSKIDSVSVLGKDIVGAAGEASNQQLEAMEEYMKNRRITSRTGATPMKKDDRPFPTFEATSVPAEKMMSVENSSSISNLSGAETLAGHKRRRLSDACPVTADDVMPAAKDAPEQSENVAPIRAESTWTANASTSSSSQESKNPDSASATESRKATGPPAETKTSPSVNTTPSKIKPNVAVNTTPSKIKRSGSSALHKKKPVVAHPHRSMKVPSAGAAARKTSRASALAAPKRYRAKSPLG